MRSILTALATLLAAVSLGQATFNYRTVSDWGIGFQGEIAITNAGTTPLRDWELEFDFDRAFSSVWDGVLVSRAGLRTRIKNAGYNATIGAGATVTFGFVGAPGNVTSSPVNYRLITGSSGGEGTGAPAVPTLSVNVGATQVIAAWTLSYGNNASKWELMENSRRVAGGTLTPNAPNPQSGSVVRPLPEYAARRYQVVLTNSFGTSRSNAVIRTFGGASRITAAPIDGDSQATQATVALGGRLDLNLATLGAASSSYRVWTNHPRVAGVSVAGSVLTIRGLAPGRGSVRIEDTASGQVRFLGVRVRQADGSLPSLPTLGIGSVSEDTPGDLGFWQSFEDPNKNKRMDVRYIYLNGGPFGGWRTWSATDGGRLIRFVRESQRLGMVPYFVWYNIPDSDESYWVAKAHIESSDYLRAYFRDLQFALQQIARLAADDPVGFLIEPDFLGYMMQNSGTRPGAILARTSAAYEAGVLVRGVDPDFPDTLAGFVRAVNYLVRKTAPQCASGWQFNLWASPGVFYSIPSKGIVRLTDTFGMGEGRYAIDLEARETARWYMEAGVTSYGASFVALDKYGLDAGAEPGAATNPANSTWFWNADYWNNYLVFAKRLRVESGLPVVLWQLPVGRINDSQFVSPYTGSLFSRLENVARRYEDSAAAFFFGDTFLASGDRLAWFRTNRGADPRISSSGNRVVWGDHLAAARDAGVALLLFGAGVADSTDGVGGPPSDDYWWISKVQTAFPSR